MDKLKICHVITRMIVGGAQENTLLTIIDHLKKGHDVTLVTGPSPGPEGKLLEKFDAPPFDTVIIDDLVRELSPIRDFRAYRALKKYFLKEKFDVVHTHSSKAGVIARAAAWDARVPFVCHTVHGQAFHRYEKPWKNFIYKTAERWAAKRCHKIYAVAQAMIDQCVEAGIAPKSKYQVVYSGMVLDDFLNAKPDRELRGQLGIPETAPVVVAVARLFPLKGYEYFVPAAKLIADKLPETRFLIVGDGVMTEEVKAQAEELGLHFAFAGLVPPSEVHRYIAISDILAHLSLREGLPRAVVQALACGKPAISFDLDGAPEVIIPGETGYLVEPMNSDQVAEFAVELLRDNEKRNVMGEKGKALVADKFDWSRMGNVLEAEYEKYGRQISL